MHLEVLICGVVSFWLLGIGFDIIAVGPSATGVWTRDLPYRYRYKLLLVIKLLGNCEFHVPLLWYHDQLSLVPKIYAVRKWLV